MSVLKLHSRPTVVFSAADREHRRLFAEFLRTGRWTNCDVQFVASEPTEVDVGTMQRQLVEFYTAREFAKKG